MMAYIILIIHSFKTEKTMKTMKSKKTWDVILKAVIAVASAIIGAFGGQAML